MVRHVHVANPGSNSGTTYGFPEYFRESVLSTEAGIAHENCWMCQRSVSNKRLSQQDRIIKYNLQALYEVCRVLIRGDATRYVHCRESGWAREDMNDLTFNPSD